MTAILLLAFAGGVLTILSPCILPVLPLVFARTGRPFARDTLPMLLGLAAAFTLAAWIATATARWLLLANEVGRWAALALLAMIGFTLLSPAIAERIARPLTRVGGTLMTARDTGTPWRQAVVGAAIGLLWAPCAGPILGLVIAAAAVAGRASAVALFFTFAIGAIMSLAVVLALGSRLRRALARTGAADRTVRRVLGLATLVTVATLALGWDRLLFAAGGVSTNGIEQDVVLHLAPEHRAAAVQAMSLDDFASNDAALRAPINLGTRHDSIPSLQGGTEWINSMPLTRESLRGKVVLIDFWTFACYNCLNALPHVKELYAKYKDRGFVVIGVHTPELAHERIPENVRREVKRLGIEYPVVIDNDNKIWNAFGNEYWPAAYYADANGTMRFYHFGEGRYEDQDKVVARLLAERDLAAPKP